MSSRILIVDDHTLVRQSLSKLLTAEGFEVVGEADNGFDAVDQARRLQPDVVLVDLYLPRLDGVATTKVIKRELPHVEVVLLTASENVEHIVEAVHAGACGYVFKSADSMTLLKQLRQVLAGGVGMSEDITIKLIKNLAHTSQTHRNPGVDSYTSLTPREREVLALIAQGHSNKAIGAELCVSSNTVRAHVRCLMQKLSLDNRTQLAVYGLREGLYDAQKSAFPRGDSP
jgi:two-component system, NarL family, response regulator NreC